MIKLFSFYETAVCSWFNFWHLQLLWSIRYIVLLHAALIAYRWFTFYWGVCLIGSCGSIGSDLLLNAEIHIHGKKKYLGNRITGIQVVNLWSLAVTIIMHFNLMNVVNIEWHYFLQFSQDSQKVMITSEDSKIRIFDGIDIVHKYRGTAMLNLQTSEQFLVFLFQTDHLLYFLFSGLKSYSCLLIFNF